MKEFDELFATIKNDKMTAPPQHFLIQGQRGYGKTTLLLRLNLEIKHEPELRSWLIPVMFTEEQYSVRTLSKFWEEVIDVLENEHEEFSGLSEKVDELYDTKNPEEEIFKLLIRTLREKKKKLVLLLDNFDEMIAKFNQKENQRFREVLNTCNSLRLIGASSTVLEFYHDYREPFFDFFKVITLDELDRAETVMLLKKLGETYKADEINNVIEQQPERIEALRRLTGGVPRTIVLLFEIFVDNVDGNSFKDLESILDRVTPLYKHRLDSLSTQQQAIIDAIAQNWDAISTKEIAREVRMDSKAVSSQLNQLEKAQLIRKIPTSTKNHLYQISERFFNIYYLMRLGKRKNRNKVLWLVRFLEIWCTETELTNRAKKHVDAIRSGVLDERHVFYFSQALAKTPALPGELQHEVVTEARGFLTQRKSEYAAEMDKSHVEVLQEVIEDLKKGRESAARRKLLDDGVTKEDVEFSFGDISRLTGDFSKAEQYYLMAVEKGDARAMYNLALLYRTEMKDFSKAEQYYLMAVEKGHAGAMYNLALLYRTEMKDFSKAEQYYLMAVEKGDADAMNNLALLYENEMKDFSKAEHYYLMAVEKGDADAMYNLALLYFDQKSKKTESLSLQRKAYDLAPGDKIAAGLVLTLLWNNEIEEALTIYKSNFDNESSQIDVTEVVGLMFLMFLAKKQYNFVYRLFEENKFEIREKYKAIYYALLSMMGNEHGDELKRMGPELQETVAEIVKGVERLAVDYA